MTRTSLVAATAALLAASAVSASAMTISVVEAICETPADAALEGIACGTTADRRDASNINLGAADGEFFSLGLGNAQTDGLGGWAILEIDPAFTGPAVIFEVTNGSTHLESADVFVGNASGSIVEFVGTINNQSGSKPSVLEIAGNWNFIGLVDASFRDYGTSTSTLDGFDIDALSVTPVPVPAGALLLGTALAGFGFARRRG